MKKIIISILSIMLLLSFNTDFTVNAESEKQFKDLKSSHWAYDAISIGVKKGYISGFPDNTFRPNDPVSIAEFITMSTKSLTDDESGFIWWSEKYTDNLPPWKLQRLNANTVNFKIGEVGKLWYENFVQNAKNMGLIHEEYNNIYNKALTREQAAKIINSLDDLFNGVVDRDYARIAGAQLLKDYNRVDPSKEEHVGATVIRGIMIGNDKGYFNPTASITRAEAAQICRMLTDKALRKKVTVNLEGVPYSLVPHVGYGPTVYIFENAEMKSVYDVMDQRRGSYQGITDSSVGTLGYYENEEKQKEAFRRKAYFDFTKSDTLHDMRISFSSNVYNINLSIEKGRTERAQEEFNKMLSLIFKDDAKKATEYIMDAVSLARNHNNFSKETTIGKREILITAYPNNGYVLIGISAYADRK